MRRFSNSRSDHDEGRRLPCFRRYGHFCIYDSFVPFNIILDHYDAFCKYVDATPSTFDLIHKTLLRYDLDGSYTDLSHFKLDKHNIFPSPEDFPPFVQAKKQQIEGRRDWSHWDHDVCAMG